MFHIAGIWLVAPSANIYVIAQIETAGAKIQIPTPDHCVKTIAVAAVYRFPAVISVCDCDVSSVVVS
ncbi:hypothetical protein D3C85_1645100 [compost metagenome]